MPIENEKRYLLSESPSWNTFDISELIMYEISQFYICYDPERKFVSRVRRIKEQGSSDDAIYIRTDKIGKGENTREIEYIINENSYFEYMEFFQIGQFISKIRYTWEKSESEVWEFDFYPNGLMIAEIELQYVGQTFDLPFKTGTYEELNDFRYSNLQMALKGVPEPKRKLDDE